jgi:hypothetical protein
MTVKLFWDDVEPTILRLDFEDEWTLEQQESLREKIREFLGDNARRSDVIIYVHEGTHFPRYLLPTQIRSAVKHIPENPGVRVVVGAPMIVQTVVDLFTMLIGDRMGVEMMTAKSLDEARSMIRQKRERQG